MKILSGSTSKLLKSLKIATKKATLTLATIILVTGTASANINSDINDLGFASNDDIHSQVVSGNENSPNPNLISTASSQGPELNTAESAQKLTHLQSFNNLTKEFTPEMMEEWDMVEVDYDHDSTMRFYNGSIEDLTALGIDMYSVSLMAETINPFNGKPVMVFINSTHMPSSILDMLSDGHEKTSGSSWAADVENYGSEDKQTVKIDKTRMVQEYNKTKKNIGKTIEGLDDYVFGNKFEKNIDDLIQKDFTFTLYHELAHQQHHGLTQIDKDNMILSMQNQSSEPLPFSISTQETILSEEFSDVAALLKMWNDTNISDAQVLSVLDGLGHYRINNLNWDGDEGDVEHNTAGSLSLLKKILNAHPEDFKALTAEDILNTAENIVKTKRGIEYVEGETPKAKKNSSLKSHTQPDIDIFLKNLEAQEVKSAKFYLSSPSGSEYALLLDTQGKILNKIM
jgi:hypothetical protein